MRQMERKGHDCYLPEKVFQFTQLLLSKGEVSVVSSCCRNMRAETGLEQDGVKKCGWSWHFNCSAANYSNTCEYTCAVCGRKNCCYAETSNHKRAALWISNMSVKIRLVAILLCKMQDPPPCLLSATVIVQEQLCSGFLFIITCKGKLWALVSWST